MNANTRLRLWKEARALLPMWAASAVWMVAAYAIFDVQHSPFSYGFPAFVFGCMATSAVCFGHEFNSRTLGSLLVQPVSRRRIFYEKLSTLAVSLVVLTALFVVLQTWRSFFFPSLIQVTNQISREEHSDFLDSLAQLVARNNLSPLQWLHVLMHFLGSAIGIDDLGSFSWGEFVPLKESLTIFGVFGLPPLLAFCTGPALTLVTRNALGGAAATFIYPFFLLIGGVLLVASQGDLSPRLEEQFLLSYVLLVGGIYSGGVFLYGCRRFERLEDANLLAQELAPPRQLSALFSCFTRHTTPGRHGATANLLRKELRLQQPAFLVALFLVALWLTFIVVWQVHPPVGAEILVVPAILLALGIPITVGIVSTAEERNLGVHEWHLTLPVSARRQWCVKVIVALGVNVLLGIALPGLLAHASSWLANNPQLVAEIPGRKLPAFLIANLVLFCAALYASTASANSMRALVGAIVVFVSGAMVMTLAVMTAERVPDSFYPMPNRFGWWPAPELCQWAYGAITPFGWGFLVWFGALGLANFKRSLEAGWRTVRRLAPFVATIWLVLTSVLTYQRMFSHYEWTYYEMSSSLRWDFQKRTKQRAAERGKLEAVPTTQAPLPNANPVKPRD